MEIVDRNVAGVVVEHNDEWYMRLFGPTLTAAIPDFPYLWYRMTEEGWLSISNGDEFETKLEVFYQENK